MTFTIRPAASGGWLAFGSGSLLLVVPDESVAIADGWSAVSSGIQAALDLLTGKGLSLTPPFVLIDWRAGADAQVLVRGDVTVQIQDAAGMHELSGTSATTWIERTFPGANELSVAIAGATAASQTLLPLESGVALVATISSGASVPAAAPAPLAAPAQATPVAPAAAAPAAAAVAPPVVSAAPEVIPPAPAPMPEPDIGVTRQDLGEAPAAPQEAPPAESPEVEYDYLFEATKFHGVSEAAVHDEPEADAAADVVDDELHDGYTRVVETSKKTRVKRPPAPSAPVVEAAQVVLVMPSGAREPLTQPILIGRSPTVGKVTGAIPRPLTFGSGDQDISRNHAKFTLEGGTVVVEDLDSRNGTTIILPGKSPERLRANQPTAVILGTVVDFGGGLLITVDEDA